MTPWCVVLCAPGRCFKRNLLGGLWCVCEGGTFIHVITTFIKNDDEIKTANPSIVTRRIYFCIEINYFCIQEHVKVFSGTLVNREVRDRLERGGSGGRVRVMELSEVRRRMDKEFAQCIRRPRPLA